MEDEPVRIPVTDVFDLHSVPPRDAKAAVEGYLEEAHELGFRALRIIHGRGIGVQREMVRGVLAATPFVRSFSDAPAEAGGWGATIVTLYNDAVEEPASRPSDELANLLLQYDSALSEAQALVEPVTTGQFNWQPRPGCWSAGQCMEHLAIASGVYAAKVRIAIDDGKRRGLFAPGPFRYGMLESYFLRLAEPPPRFRIRAPAVFRPQSGSVLQPGATLTQYSEANRTMHALVEEAAGLDLRRIKTASPATDLLQWSLGVILALIPAHDRRHLWQARQVMSAPGFPSR